MYIIINKYIMKFLLNYIKWCWWTVVLRTTGGEVAGGSTLAPKIGPLGLVNMNNNIY